MSPKARKPKSPPPASAGPAKADLPPPPSPAALAKLKRAWAARWPEALRLWSRFTRLSDPRWCLSAEEAAAEGLTQSFAMIRLNDQAVVVDLAHIGALKLDDYALEILAHEIGHHVLAPANLTDDARMIARMRWGLPGKEYLAGFIANLYTDLLINDRLQRAAELRMAEIYQVLGGGSSDPLWALYMRIYEILWRLPRGTLQPGPAIEDAELAGRLEGDAYLGARLIRSYARDWLDGSGKFAALCLPYLLKDDGKQMQRILRGWRDTEQSGAGGMPQGLTEREPGEKEGAIHPALDPALSGVEDLEADSPGKGGESLSQAGAGGSQGQHREPFEYGAILKALGLKLDDHEIAVRYYRERAAAHRVRFPTRMTPESTEPLPEGLEPWDIGSPLENADWTESVIASPHIVPGMTTVQRVWGTTEGSQPAREPLDLDLYVDCSGSMPNPQLNVSYLALAGAIVVLSALRAGARVQATLWSGAGQFDTSGGFIRDEHRLLRILTGYLGGATAFPIHILRDTFAQRKPGARPAHILVVSDDGVTTMFDKDEKGNSGWDVARQALEKARGGGTLVLNLWGEWEKDAALKRAHDEQGWQIHRVRTWDELVTFAREFSRLKYGEPERTEYGGMGV